MRRMSRFGYLLLGLTIAMPLTMKADGQDDRNNDRDCRDGDHLDHNRNTPVSLAGVIPIPGNPLASSDIAWVDPGTERYYVADRSNKGVDIIDAENHFWVARVEGMVGVAGTPDGTTANNGSGPNGVVVTPGRRLWAGDGNDTLVVADVDPNSGNYLSILQSINLSVTDPASPSFCDDGTANGHWCGRADEIGYDSRHHVILIATPGPLSPVVNPACPPRNHCPVQPYAQLVSADPPYSILQTFSFANSGGLEQPLWDPGLNRFWLTVPGTAAAPPQIVRIDSTKLTIDKTITLDCKALGGSGSSITGIALAPFQHLLVSACGFPVDVSAISGNAKLITKGVGGGDEVWYNSGDGRFYVHGNDTSTPPVSSLGVIDAEHDVLLQTVHDVGGKNPAAFAENNNIFTIVGTGAGTACEKFGLVGRGCIAVFSHKGDDGDEDDDR